MNEAEEIAEMRAIVRALAESWTITDNDYGDTFCTLCEGGRTMTGRFLHEDTCLITRAKALVKWWETGEVAKPVPVRVAARMPSAVFVALLDDAAKRGAAKR